MQCQQMQPPIGHSNQLLIPTHFLMAFYNWLTDEPFCCGKILHIMDSEDTSLLMTICVIFTCSRAVEASSTITTLCYII